MRLVGFMSVLLIAALVIAERAGASDDVAAPEALSLPGKTKQLVRNDQPGLVTQIVSYEEYGGGDVTFKVDKPTPGCSGYWLKTSDPGFKSNLSILLMARSSRVPVYAYGADDRLWPGSSEAHCHLYMLQLP